MSENTEEKPLVLAMLGKSGAGKGTQVNLLKETFDFEYIGSGELLRAKKLENDFTGKSIAKAIDSGDLVPTPVIFALWMQRLNEIKETGVESGILIDGSPRKILEAQLLEESIKWFGWDDNFKIILIDITDEEALKRIKERSKNSNRPEDGEDGTKKRLAWFKKEVEPVISFYEKNGRLIRINGEQSVEDVYSEILKKVKL